MAGVTNEAMIGVHLLNAYIHSGTTTTGKPTGDLYALVFVTSLIAGCACPVEFLIYGLLQLPRNL
jgi:hypothetical protein